MSAIILCLVVVNLLYRKVSHQENYTKSVLAMTQMFDDTTFIAISQMWKLQGKTVREVFDIKRVRYY